MKISIITISFNPGITLERTINSVISQSYTDIEWIIVDGGSNDGSLEAYKKVQKYIDIIVSEPDKGIADAMNKGLNIASGEAIIYLNAGDEFANADVIKKIVENWDTKKYQWATGGGRFYDEAGSFLYERLMQDEKSQNLVNKGCRILHAATILKRETLINAGGFSLKYRSSMDYELWLRLIYSDIFPQILLFPVVKFYLGGMSSNILQRYSEDRKARRLHGASKLPLEIRLYLISVFKQILRPVCKVNGIYVLKEWLKI